MEIVNSELHKATIILDSVDDKIIDSRLVECKIVERVPVCVIESHITTDDVVEAVNVDIFKPHARIDSCVLVECEMPKACYDSNYFQKVPRFTAKNVSIP